MAFIKGNTAIDLHVCSSRLAATESEECGEEVDISEEEVRILW